MANYTNLKNAIAQVIKTNGNEEITGNVMQTTLRTIVDSVGAYRTFGGIVQPSTSVSTIDQNTFFMAYSPGEYTNFGGIVFNGVGILLLYNTPTGWQSEVVQLEVEDGSVTADKLAERSVGNSALQDEIINQDKIKAVYVHLSELPTQDNPTINLTSEDIVNISGLSYVGWYNSQDNFAKVYYDDDASLTPIKYTYMSDGEYNFKETMNFVVKGRVYTLTIINVLTLGVYQMRGTITLAPDKTIIDVKYSQLRNMNGNYIAGMKYRITDYVTKVRTSEDYISIEQPFCIIVEALTSDVLSSEAKATWAEFDDYFVNSNLPAWEIKYDIDNDTTKYEWADETNGKGVIYWMRDEFGNEAGYDFKNINFAQYRIVSRDDLHLSNSVAGGSVTEIRLDMLKEYLGSAPNSDNYHAFFSPHYGTGRYVTKSALSGITYQDGWTPQDGEKYINLSFSTDYEIVGKVVSANRYYFTFDKRTTIDSVDSEDYSLTGKVKNVKIFDKYTGDTKQLNIVSFVGYNVNNEMIGVEIGEHEASTSVINIYNTEQVKMKSINKASLAAKYSDIDILEYTTFGLIYNGKIKQAQRGFIKSINKTCDIALLSSFSFGSVIVVNIGNYCSDIVIGESSNNVSIGDNSSSVHIGESTTATIADNAQHITIGNGCIVNAGSYLWGVSVADYMEVKFGNKCQYIDVSCSLTPSVSQMCQGIIVEDMVSGTYNSHYTIVSNALSQEYPTRYRNTDTQINDFPASSSSSDETILTFVGKIIKKMTPTALLNFIISKLTPTDFVLTDYVLGADSNTAGKIGSMNSLSLAVTKQNDTSVGIVNEVVTPQTLSIGRRNANDYVKITQDNTRHGQTIYDIDIVDAWSGSYYGTFKMVYTSDTFHATFVLPKIYLMVSKNDTVMKNYVKFYSDDNKVVYMTSSDNLTYGWSAIITKKGNRTQLYGTVYTGSTEGFTEITVNL